MDDIKFIKQIMAESRRVILDHGMSYILWGVLLPVGTAVSYILGYCNQAQYIGYFWLGLSITGWIIQFIMALKKEKREKIKSRLARLYGLLYLGLGILFVIITILYIVMQMISFIIFMFLLCLLLAFAYYISAIFNRLKWLYPMSAGWMISGITILFLPELWGPGIISILIILFALIPGIWMQKNKDKLYTD
ncbi:MAG: hypothetical protein JW822_02885 [Spirochaetales bacterium]|nr:hypothetical protein [Spirochaetales bacterium]